MALILTRKVGQSIIIAGRLRLTVEGIHSRSHVQVSLSGGEGSVQRARLKPIPRSIENLSAALHSEDERVQGCIWAPAVRAYDWPLRIWCGYPYGAEVRLGIDAPRHVSVNREEVEERMDTANGRE